MIMNIPKICFVLGNGPSLRDFDFFRLEGEGVDTIGMNAAYRYWDRIGWYPTHYCCLDDQLIETHHEEIERLYTSGRVRKVFVHWRFFDLHPQWSGHEDFFSIDQVVPGLYEKRGKDMGFMPLYEHPAFATKNFSKITTGAYATRFAIYLGYMRVALLGIDLQYQETLPEATSEEGYRLIMTSTPDYNPNYFFDDYQKEGDRYNIPNPEEHKGNLHLQSFELLNEDLHRNNVQTTVINCNMRSKLYENAIFKYENVDHILSNYDLGAVCVPCNLKEIKRILQNIRLWSTETYYPLYSNDQGGFCELVFLFNNQSAKSQQPVIEESLRSYGIDKVFKHIRFEYLNLEGEKDLYLTKDQINQLGSVKTPWGYLSGPNHQFFQAMRLLRNLGRYVFMMETDCVPIRRGWLSYLRELVKTAEPFWVLGSAYRGIETLSAPLRRHINGNAIYAVGDPDFQDFVQQVWKPKWRELIRKGQMHIAYDHILEFMFSPQSLSDESYWLTWQKIAHKIRYTGYIQNISAPSDIQRSGAEILSNLDQSQSKTFVVHNRALTEHLQQMNKFGELHKDQMNESPRRFTSKKVPTKINGDEPYIAIITPFWHGDAHRAELHWRYLNRLGCKGQEHIHVFKHGAEDLPLVTLPWIEYARIEENYPEHSAWPHPAGPNLVFMYTLQMLQKSKFTHFFWLEPDCLPVTTDWLEKFRSAAQKYPDQPIIGAGGGSMYPDRPHWRHHFAGCSLYNIQKLSQLNWQKFLDRDLEVSFDIWLAVALGYIRLKDMDNNDTNSTVIYGRNRYRWELEQRPECVLSGIFEHWRPEKVISKEQLSNILMNKVYFLYHAIKDQDLIVSAFKNIVISATVVIINYNNEKYLEQAIKSALQQRGLQNIIYDVLVVDDGSTDASVEIIRSFQEQIKAIYLSHGPHNPNFNQQRALLKALGEHLTGDVVLLLDGDDIFSPDKLATLVPVFDDPEVILAQHTLELIDDQDNKLGICKNFPEEDPIDSHLYQRQKRVNFFQPTSGLAFRNCFLRHALRWLRMDRFENTWLDVRLTRMAPFFGRVLSLDQCLGKWRRHPKSDSIRRNNVRERIAQHHAWFNHAGQELGVSVNYQPQQEHRRANIDCQSPKANISFLKTANQTSALSTGRHTEPPDQIFLFGNGPSLARIRLEEIKSWPCIGMNVAFRHWHKIKWYPTYYICLDAVITESQKDEIFRMVQEQNKNQIRLFLLRKNILKFYPELNNNSSVLFLDDYLKAPLFEGTAPITTGSHATLFGAMLGFKKIYLLGIDCNYVQLLPEAENKKGSVLEMTKTPNKNPNYFFDDYQQKGDRFNIPDSKPDLHYNSWLMVKERLENRGVDVVNCSPVSKLDMFDYVPLDKVLGKRCRD